MRLGCGCGGQRRGEESELVREREVEESGAAGLEWMSENVK